jgi:branched-chain amino acid transport system permease protein
MSQGTRPDVAAAKPQAILQGPRLVAKSITILCILGLALLAAKLSPYNVELLTQVLIYGIFAMSLDLLIGYTGLPSLGHAAYFGVSAYAAAIFSLQRSWPFALAAPAGLIAAMIAAGLFNLLALRTAQAYYLMITLAFSQVLWSLAVSWTDLTGGDNGLPGVSRPELGWLIPWSLVSSRGYFYFVLGVFVLAGLAMYVFVHSPFGYALKGIRENEKRMKALGYNTWAYKYVVSLISALFAGLAGELYLYLNSFVSPSALSVTVSAQVLMMILVGAAGTLFGPILGAALFVFLQYVLSSYTERWLFVIGLIYVLVALFTPQGALTLITSRWQRRTPQ